MAKFGPTVAVPLEAGEDPVLSVTGGSVFEHWGQPIAFTVRLTPAATSEVRVDYRTQDGWDEGDRVLGREYFAAEAGVDYTPVEGTLVFAPGETSKTVEVEIADDGVEDSDEIFAMVLANESGARMGDRVARGTIRNHERLTASFGELPESHDGAAAFAFELAFSESVTAGAEGLRDGALSVTGGAVSAVRALDGDGGRRFEVTVAPAGAGDVTVALGPTASCGAAGAVCTADGVGLERRFEATVAHAGTARAVSGRIVSEPGGNGVWDAGETVSVEVAFSEAGDGRRAGERDAHGRHRCIDGVRREAAYAGGSGTAALRFEHAVTAADAGARECAGGGGRAWRSTARPSWTATSARPGSASRWRRT